MLKKNKTLIFLLNYFYVYIGTYRYFVKKKEMQRFCIVYIIFNKNYMQSIKSSAHLFQRQNQCVELMFFLLISANNSKFDKIVRFLPKAINRNECTKYKRTMVRYWTIMATANAI